MKNIFDYYICTFLLIFILNNATRYSFNSFSVAWRHIFNHILLYFLNISLNLIQDRYVISGMFNWCIGILNRNITSLVMISWFYWGTRCAFGWMFLNNLNSRRDFRETFKSYCLRFGLSNVFSFGFRRYCLTLKLRRRREFSRNRGYCWNWKRSWAS